MAEEKHMGHVVCVRRIVTAEYTVPVEHYTLDGTQMTEEQIREVEEDPDQDPSILLDNIVNEEVSVTFFVVTDEEGLT